MSRAPRTRRALHLAGLGLCLCAASGSASAQEEPLSKHDLALGNETLRQRNRGALHPGDALTIQGIEQADNDLRSKTPALANATRSPATLDVDDAYRRALALYGEGAHFTSAPAAPVAFPEPAQGRRHRSRDTEEPPTVETPAAAAPASRSGAWFWILSTTATIAVIGWFVRKSRLAFGA